MFKSTKEESLGTTSNREHKNWKS